MPASDREPGAVTPWSVPADADQVVLFGGSFDPPTLAHIAMGAAARAGDAWLVLVPAARSPHKESAPTADEHRLAMLGAASAGVERCAIWTDELDRAASGEPSYWVETLRRARTQCGEADLRFVIGADQAVALHRWRESHELLELAGPLVVPRAPVVTLDALRSELQASGAWAEGEIETICAGWCGAPPIDASATAARSALRAGADDDALSTLLHADVLAYIRHHSLYRA